MPTTKTLSLDLLRIDGGTQNRISINEDAVDDYATLIKEAHPEWPFGPLDVFHDGSEYFVADGFHRTLAGIRAGRASAPCRVHKGAANDARIFGMTANDRHGLRMTQADKRACVGWLLDTGGKMAQKEIAEKAGVGVRLVKTIVADRKPKFVPKQPPPMATKVLLAPPPTSVESYGLEHDPFDDIDPSEEREGKDGRTDSDGTDSQETPPRPPRKGKDKLGRLPTEYDRSFWYKQWEQSIGPLVRLVDKIAEGVGERRDPHHDAIHAALETATEEMAIWMKVK